MSKGTQFLTLAIPTLILYLLAFVHIVPTPFLSVEHADAILPALPWWLLVTFGAYSLSSLGLGLVRVHDCPEAYESLLKEIHQARTELRDQGVSVD